MEKSFLKFSEEITIMILSIIVVLFSFFNSNTYNGNIISFLFQFIKSCVFFSVPFFVCFFDNKRENVKKVAAIYSSYFIINLLITILFSFSNSIILVFVKTVSDLISLMILLSGLLIFIEYFLKYNSIQSKVYNFTVMKIVYLVGETMSYPFLYFINKKVGK